MSSRNFQFMPKIFRACVNAPPAASQLVHKDDERHRNDAQHGRENVYRAGVLRICAVYQLHLSDRCRGGRRACKQGDEQYRVCVRYACTETGQTKEEDKHERGEDEPEKRDEPYTLVGKYLLQIHAREHHTDHHHRRRADHHAHAVDRVLNDLRQLYAECEDRKADKDRDYVDV